MKTKIQKVNQLRRSLLQAGSASASLALTAGFGLLTPLRAFAERPVKAFAAGTAEATLANLYDNKTPQASDRVELKVAESTESGASVSVQVSTELKNVESISIIVAKNQQPLVATFLFSKSAEAYIATRIKMAGSSNLIAVVKTADGKLHSASQDVNVNKGVSATNNKGLNQWPV